MMIPLSARTGIALMPPTVAARELARMRMVASGLLLAMTALFILTHLAGESQGLWGYARAFAEAAMVGGLADWFAVTALFRRPFGLPIPHTAVIPRNQDRIADAIGKFIAENFLRPDLVRSRLAERDLTHGLALRLSDPLQARSVASGLVSAVPGLIDALDDQVLIDFVRRQLASAGAATRIAPTLPGLLESVFQKGGGQALIDILLAEGFRILERSESDIRRRIRQETGWVMRMIKVDQKAADALIAAIETLLSEAAADPDHPLRSEVARLARSLAERLRHDAALQRRLEALIAEAIAHPAAGQAIASVWSVFKDNIRNDCATGDSQLTLFIQQAAVNIGRELLADAATREALNGHLGSILTDLADRHGGDVANLVSDTIRSWDSATIVAKLETNVGRDLQFIRINGTVIGGLVGLILHSGSDLLGR
jgi:uncharacterized membrane-anchored protein YjiN (DUF445 family)